MLAKTHDVRVSQFPSLKTSELLRVLSRDPLNYQILRNRGKGSHRILRAPGRRDIIFGFHDGVTIPPGIVRKVLTINAGLSVTEALGLVRRR
jgi:predicted RNA binding protein YcfA (HicA-like mRNA interferase family)